LSFGLIVGAFSVSTGFLIRRRMFCKRRIAQQIKRAIAKALGKTSGPTGTFLNFLKLKVYIKAEPETSMPIMAQMMFAFFIFFH
jgi:hypothetical protein